MTPSRRRRLRLYLAAAWCGLLAVTGTVAGVTLLAAMLLVLREPGGGWYAPGYALVGTVLLGLAVPLWVALVRLLREPPSGARLAAGCLCGYAAAAFALPLVQLLQGGTFWPLAQRLTLAGVALLASAALVGWAARTRAPRGCGRPERGV